MIRRIICVNAVISVMLWTCFCLYPALRAASSIRDPALRGPGTPKIAWRLFGHLTPHYASWARTRVAQGTAADLSVHDISGTEWPLFGSVFYLWAVENLQQAWEAGDRAHRIEPKAYAREAIRAAADLVIDSNHAHWVKQHWGANYLQRENVFYRMLVIAAMTSRERLLRDGARLDLLRDQVEGLSKELDASKSGLLDDYPGECYPGDVMAAVMCIKRADSVLHMDHSEFVRRAIRAFTGEKLTRHRLPPYAANAGSGLPVTESRGCGNSYVCLTAPELWPDQAKAWFEAYDRFFWQERLSAVGYREFSKDVPNTEWFIDVDAGPVVAGHGFAASAFGVGAARKNGRLDRAYPLAAQMLTTVWELPNGMLAGPRLLSNLSDAPMLGEAVILSQLATQPEAGFTIRRGGRVPAFTYIILLGAVAVGSWRVLAAVLTFRAALTNPEPVLSSPRFQATSWAAFVLAALVAVVAGYSWAALLILAIAVFIPIRSEASARTDG